MNTENYSSRTTTQFCTRCCSYSLERSSRIFLMVITQKISVCVCVGDKITCFIFRYVSKYFICLWRVQYVLFSDKKQLKTKAKILILTLFIIHLTFDTNSLLQETKFPSPLYCFRSNFQTVHLLSMSAKTHSLQCNLVHRFIQVLTLTKKLLTHSFGFVILTPQTRN